MSSKWNLAVLGAILVLAACTVAEPTPTSPATRPDITASVDGNVLATVETVPTVTHRIPTSSPTSAPATSTPGPTQEPSPIPAGALTPSPNIATTESPTATPAPIPASTRFATATLIPTPVASTESPTATPAPTPASTRFATATPTPTPTHITSPKTTSIPIATLVPTPTQGPTHTEDTGSKGCVSDPNPEFTAHITDLSKIEFILAPMVISGNRFKGRSYVWIGRNQTNQVFDVPVYAPVDSKLTRITFYAETGQNEMGQQVDVEQYSLRFEVSCEVSYGYDHILNLAENIAAIAPTVPANSTRDTALRTSLFVRAGDLIGSTTGTAAAHNWDFVFNNSSKRNEFVNQERYEFTGDLNGLVTADCPYDYYGEKMRGELYALLIGGAGGKIAGPGCLISHDKPGTIAGGWFKQPYSREASHDFLAGWALAVGTWAFGQIRITDEQS